MKNTTPLLAFAFTLALPTFSQAATVASVDVYYGSVGGNPADTFTRLSTSGGAGPNGTRLGLASTASTAREIAGTSNAVLWTIAAAGTYELKYHLDNTVNAQFRPGNQGLYDASSGVATTAAGVDTAITNFAGLTGVTVSISPSTPPASLDTGSGGTGAPAVLFTTTYTVDVGSDAIGKDVAVGFYSSWNGPGGYIFGREDGANQVTLDFTAVPEPSSTALLGLGGLALILRRRK